MASAENRHGNSVSGDIWSQLESGRERRRRLAFERKCVDSTNTCVDVQSSAVSTNGIKKGDTTSPSGDVHSKKRALSYAAVAKMNAKSDKEHLNNAKCSVYSTDSTTHANISKSTKGHSLSSLEKQSAPQVLNECHETDELNLASTGVHRGVWLNKAPFSSAEKDFYVQRSGANIDNKNSGISRCEMRKAQSTNDCKDAPMTFAKSSIGVWLEKSLYSSAEKRYYEDLARSYNRKRGKKGTKKDELHGTEHMVGQGALHFELDDMYYEDAILPTRQSSVTMTPTLGFMASHLSESLLPEEQLDSLRTEPDMDMEDFDA